MIEIHRRTLTYTRPEFRFERRCDDDDDDGILYRLEEVRIKGMSVSAAAIAVVEIAAIKRFKIAIIPNYNNV